jgi:hypothetical protein
MEWARGEEQVSLVFEADDARKVALRSSALAAPPQRSGPNPFVVGCVTLPFLAIGACLTSVHHAPAANALGYCIVVLVVLAAAGLSYTKKPRALPSVRSVFTLVITPTTLTQLADGSLVAEIDLADIADVTAIGDELFIVRRDASQLRLAAPSAGAVEMAGEVDARIREMRSLRGGYR